MIASFRAGDSWQFGTRAFDGYSAADGWSLQWILNSPLHRAVLGSESVSAAADGVSFLTRVPAATSAGIAPGIYEVLAVLSKSGDRATFEFPAIGVLPDVAGSGSPVDTRSFAKKTLDAIEAALAGDTSMLVQSYEIHGRKIQYTDRGLLHRYRSQFMQEYQNEQIARGEIQRTDFLRVGM